MDILDKICIIVPIYNVENYVKKCLTSLVNQTYKNIEIMAMIDGSPDNSAEIVKKMAEKDNRIICIEKENGGYGSVLEYGIKNTKCKYFLICDPDDWLEENAIEILYNLISTKNVDIAIGEIYKIYKDSKSGELSLGTHKSYHIEPNKVYNDLSNFYFFRPTPHAKLYKTELAKNIKFPHKVSYTDNVLFDVYLSNSKSAIYVDTPLAYYFFDRPGNTMGEFDNNVFKQKTFEAVLTVFESIINQLYEESYSNPYAYYRVYCELISTLSKLKNLDKKNQKEKDIERIISLINKIYPVKEKMSQCINDNNIKLRIAKKIIFSFMFCKFSQKAFAKILSNLKRK